METDGNIYHPDMQIEWDPPTPIQHVLQCEVFNMDDHIICKFWSKNFKSVVTTQSQHYLKIQSYLSFSPTPQKHATLVGLMHSIIRNCTDDLPILQATTQVFIELISLLFCPAEFVIRSFQSVLTKHTHQPIADYIVMSLSKLGC